jgi:repressor LexA
MKLPERQRLILQVIEAAVEQQGYPPTVREIGAAVGLCSPASVQSHLGSLEAKGYIRRGTSKRRALEVVRHSGREQAFAAVAGGMHVPLVGRVAAGLPLLAEENIEESIDIPHFLGARGCFALRVTGTSMINAGILDGDIVDEATLKRFYREADQVRLQPENDSMEPIFTRHPRIAGKVTGVLRKL